MIQNPFLSRRPVDDPSSFFGRHEEARKVVELFGGIVPQCCSVVGERRIGKTSLLKFVSHPQGGLAEFSELLARQTNHYLFVYIDLALSGLDKLKPEEESDVWQARILFFRYLFSRLDQAVQDKLEPRPELQEIRSKIDGLFENHYREGHYPASTLLHELVVEGIDEYLRKIDGEDIVLVLLLDEADTVVKLGVGHMLRALIGDRSLAYVIATERPLHELDPEKKLSPLYNLCTPIQLGLLRREDAQTLVINLAAKVGYLFSDRDLAFIMEIGGHHPDFTKVTARHVFDAREIVESTEPPDALYPEIYLDLEANCRRLWESLRGEERRVVRRIADRQPLTPQVSHRVKELAKRGIIGTPLSDQPQLFSRVFEEYVQGQLSSQSVAVTQKTETVPQPMSPTPELVFGEGYFSFNGVKVSVTQQELRLLKCLYAHAGQVCTRQQLYDQVWKRGAYIESKAPTVNIAVQRLRDKLKTHLGDRVIIESERGQGYRLIL